MDRKTILGAVVIVVIGGAIGLIVFLGKGAPTTAAPVTPSPSPTISVDAPRVNVPSTAPKATPTPSKSTEPTGSATPSPSGSETSSTIPVEPTPKWVPTMLKFAQNYSPLGDRSIEQWRSDLKPYSTAAMVKYLDTVKAKAVPKGKYQEYEVVKAEDKNLVAALVTYGDGTQKVVFLVGSGDTWSVDGIDDYES